jgi:hypothetical protein
MVCSKDYEERHPQELIRPRRERGPLPWTRHPADLFITDQEYYIADGRITADGSERAQAGSTPPTTEIHVPFGPIDPDSL